MQGSFVFSQAGVDTEVAAGSRKKQRTKKERSMRKSLAKMKAHVGSKKNKEEKKMKDKKMKAKETPKVDDELMPSVLGTKGYDGPHFSEVLKRVVDGPSGKKEVSVVRLNKGLLDYMSQQTYPPPPSKPFPFMDLQVRKMEEKFFARDKAVCEARDNILKQYKDLGYAEMLLSDPDDEKE